MVLKSSDQSLTVNICGLFVLIFTGQLYMFSLGKIQILYVTDPFLAREMSHCTSMGLGKPAYLQHELGPLLGRGILTSNGSIWTHQRKTLAPELSMEKVKVQAS